MFTYLHEEVQSLGPSRAVKRWLGVHCPVLLVTLKAMVPCMAGGLRSGRPDCAGTEQIQDTIRSRRPDNLLSRSRKRSLIKSGISYYGLDPWDRTIVGRYSLIISARQDNIPSAVRPERLSLMRARERWGGRGGGEAKHLSTARSEGCQWAQNNHFLNFILVFIPMSMQR